MGYEYTGDIVKDFEGYLIRRKLWFRYKENPLAWVQRIGALMEKTMRYTKGEIEQLGEDGFKWWTELVQMQTHYGSTYDLFGSYVEQTGLTSQLSGQFFTPMSVCIMMNELVYDEAGEKICDPACGSGRMMIAHSIVAEKQKSNCRHIYHNMDIDYKSFVFTTLNACLRNLESVNTWGNTLTGEERKTYVTIPTELGMSVWYDQGYMNKLNEEREEQEKEDKAV